MQSQLNGLSGRVAVDAADDLLDLHEVKRGIGRVYGMQARDGRARQQCAKNAPGKCHRSTSPNHVRPTSWRTSGATRIYYNRRGTQGARFLTGILGAERLKK